MDDNKETLEELERKLKNMEELTDDEIQELLKNYSDEQLSEIMNHPSALSAMKVVSNAMSEINAYISSVINNIDNKPEIVSLLASAQIFAANYINTAASISDGTYSNKWEFKD